MKKKNRIQLKILLKSKSNTQTIFHSAKSPINWLTNKNFSQTAFNNVVHVQITKVRTAEAKAITKARTKVKVQIYLLYRNIKRYKNKMNDGRQPREDAIISNMINSLEFENDLKSKWMHIEWEAKNHFTSKSIY